MNDSVRICALGVICAMICVLMRHSRAEFAVPARLSALVIVFSLAVFMISPVFKLVRELMSESLPIEYAETVIKALAIAYLTQISGELCRDCGESGIASGIETAGKIEIMVLSLPLINKIISLSEELMSW